MKLIAIILTLFILMGCKKESTTLEEEAFVSFINTVPGILQPLSVIIDTNFIERITYRASLRNIQLTPGAVRVSILDSARTKTFLNLTAQEFTNNTSTTIIIYDTLKLIDSTVKAIRLSDDLTLAPSGFVKVRFIHAAPSTSRVDVTFLRTSVTPFDSLTVAMQSYIGNAPDIVALSTFQNIPLGAYTVKIKAAGTQDTLMNTTKLTVANLAGFAGISGISTMYLTGGVQNQPLQVGLFRHYP